MEGNEKEENEEEAAESPSVAEESGSGEEPSSATSPPVEISEDETSIVTRALQKLVTLPRLDKALWSQQAIDVMRHYVEERTEETLTVSLDGDQLVALTGSPRCTSACVVFRRMRAEPLKVDKLFQQVTHLSIPGHVTEAALVILESGFAQPFVYNNSTWPLSLKTRLCGLLHELFSELGRQQHVARGLTMLYVPKEGLEDTQDNTIILGRFEEAIARWYEQVSAAVSAEQLDSKLPLITDIIAFWNKKYENMCFLEKQLNGKAIQTILPMLDVAQSDAGRQLRSIITQATRGKTEAQSNTKYLRNLNDPCSKLAECTDLSAIVPYMTKLLNVIRLIWLKAPHFNSRSRVMQLFLCLSHQIIDVCTRTVNLRAIFKGRPVYGTERAVACILCCQDYMQLYGEISELHRKYTEYPWDLDTQEIFSSILTFISRSKDLREICEAMMIFGRINEKSPITKPLFSGPNGPAFEKICDEVRSQILKELEAMTRNRNIILDVTCATWQDEMNRFRSQIECVERRIEALTHAVMANTSTVDEALRAMHALHHFLQKSSFKSLWREKSDFVYGLFLSRIESVSQSMLGGENVGYTDLPPYSGAAMMANHNKMHLQRQMRLLSESSVLTECEKQENVIKEYKFLLSVIEDTIQEYRDMWTASLTGDWEARLRRPLLILSPSHTAMIEPTLSRDVVQCMHEARVWQSLGFDPPSHMQELCNRENAIIELRESMLTICRTYNETMARTTDAEKCLFKDLILRVDKELNPAFSHYSWRSKLPPEFIVKCTKAVDDLLAGTRKFHADCKNIIRVCAEISVSSLIDIKPESLYDGQDIQKNLIAAIKPRYEEVFQLLLKVKKQLGKITPNTLKHWSTFVSTIANVVDEAVILLIREALQKLLTQITENPDVIIHVTASIQNNMITFDPPMSQIMKTIYNTLDCIIHLTKSLPKFDDIMKIPVSKKILPLSIKLTQNIRCRELQNLLSQEADCCKDRIQEYAESWEIFSWLWTMDCQQFITGYENRNPFAASISQDIDRIGVLVEEANLNTTLQVLFIEVNATSVKDEILQHVRTWQSALLVLLLESTLAKAQKFNSDLTNDMIKLSRETETVQELAEKTMDCQFAMGHIPSKDIQLQILFEHKELLAHYKVPIPEVLKDELDTASNQWKNYLLGVESAKNTLQASKESFRAKLIDTGNALNRELAKLCSEVHKNGPFQTTWEESAALNFLDKTKKHLQDIKVRKEEIGRQFDMFGLEPPQLAELQNIENILDILCAVWLARKSWVVCWTKYKQCQFSELETDQLDEKVDTISRRLGRLAHEPAREWPVLEDTRLAVENVRHALPLVRYLRSPALRTRHWERIQTAVGRDFNPRSETFTLNEAMKMGVTNFEDEIKVIVEDADLEFNIENMLHEIEVAWESVKLEIELPPRSKISKVTSANNICKLIDQHLGQLAVIEASRYMVPFFEEVKRWKKKLYRLLDTIDVLISVQKILFRLVPITLEEEIASIVPDIKSAMKRWSNLMLMHKCEESIMHVVFSDVLDYAQKLDGLKHKVETAWHGLQVILDEKCRTCPRLCFLSSHEKLLLLQLGHDNNLAHHIMCICFPGTTGLRFGRQIDEVLGFCSANGELLHFIESVCLQGTLEEKIKMLEKAMKTSLHSQVIRSTDGLMRNPVKRERWMRVFVGQVCIIASKIWWTAECTRALQECAKSERRKPLKLLRQEQEVQVSKLCEVMKEKLTPAERLKVTALLTCEIHSLDVIDKLYDLEHKDPASYDWLAQLRFYRDVEHNIVECRQMFGSFSHDYEYYGDTYHPIVTPQTDRCSIFLTTLLNLKMGGLVQGPQGSGKSEMLRGLAINLGRLIFNVNCNQNMNHNTFATILRGIAELGAWGVLKDFLNAPDSVLSILSQHLRHFLDAMFSSKEKITLLESEITLHPNTAIFVTLTTDEIGYSKRTLPSNLRALFRPVSINTGDTCLVVEMTLLAEGISEANAFAHKICRLYELCKLHLSDQPHYDFGSRRLIKIAKNSGAYKRLNPTLPDEEVILQTVAEDIEPMLTPEDLKIYLEFTSDLFPGVEAKPIMIKRLSTAISNTLQKNGLIQLPFYIKMCLQVFEALKIHRSVMLVGNTGSGKTTTYVTLAQALESTRGFSPVQIHRIYPNALTYEELYGKYDDVTGEYKLGTFSKIMKEICTEEPEKCHWIIFDGITSQKWVSVLFEILDDSGVLTLGNGERINIPDKVKFIFEMENFAPATPSLAPYCCFMYFDHKKLGYWPYIQSWLETIDDGPQKDEISRLLSLNLDHCLKFKETDCIEITQQTPFTCVQTFCRLLKYFLQSPENKTSLNKGTEESVETINRWYFFCLVWSIFGAVEREYHSQIEVFMRDLDGIPFPADGTVFDFCYDPIWGGYLKWFDKFPSKFMYSNSIPFYKMVVPSADLIRFTYVISALINDGHPILLTGNIGTGKSIITENIIKNLNKEKFSTITINSTAMRSKTSVVRMIHTKLEKRSSNVLVPTRGKQLLTVLDDVSLLPRNEEESPRVLEMMRCWLEHGAWYDANQLNVTLKKMQLLCTLQHRGGESGVSSRLQRQFSIFNLSEPSDAELSHIFGSMFSQHLLGFGEQIKQLGKTLINASISIYRAVRKRLLPSPNNSHYVFNIKDIATVFQGLLLSNRECHNTRSAMCKLWLHENMRVYNDRLANTKDREWFIKEISHSLVAQFKFSMQNLCTDNKLPLFGNFSSKPDEANVYVEMSTEDAQEHLQRIVTLHDEKLVVFRDVAEHVTRLVRTLSQPASHLMLLGKSGNGRRSLTRLACHICSITLHFAEIGSKVANQVSNFKLHLKKIIHHVAVRQEQIAFLITDAQMVQEEFLDIIHNIIANAQIHDLFDEKEIEQIDSEINEAEDQISCFDPDEARAVLVDRVRHNLHIILCFDHNNESFGHWLYKYPALTKCSMNYFSTWPSDALLQVAEHNLVNKIKLTGNQAEIVQKLSNVLVQFHESTVKTVEQFNLNIAITPVHYIDCLKCYSLLLKSKQEELRARVAELKLGLQKIEETKKKVETMSEALLQSQRQVLERQRRCEAALVTLGQRRREVDEQGSILAVRTNQFAQEEAATQQLDRLARAAMDEALPCLEEADMALDSLNYKELQEMRAYGRPPENVELVMSAVLIFKQSEPTWVEAKRQLADTNFIEQLHNFDKDHIPDKTLKSISSFTSNPEFIPEKIGTISIPAKYLALWVIAIEKYGKIYRAAAPKRAKIERASRDLRDHQAELADLQTRLSHLEIELMKQKDEYEKRVEERDTLHVEAEVHGSRLQRANDLVSGLASDEERWRSIVQLTSKYEQLLLGDCLIAAAMLTYGGSFSTENRNTLQNYLTRYMKNSNLSFSDDKSFSQLLEDKVTLRQWKLLGLPGDSFSVDSAIMTLFYAKQPLNRWPLVLDPQNIAKDWIRALPEFKELRYTNQNKTDFIQTLEACIENGYPLIIEKVENSLNPALYPILQKQDYFNENVKTSITFNGKTLLYHPGFKLIFITPFYYMDFGADFSSKINVIDFTLQTTGLEEILLGIVIKNDKPTLEEDKTSLSNNILSGYQTLQNQERDILRILLETPGSLLDQEAVMDSLEQNKAATIKATQRLASYEESELEITAQRQVYLPCATRAAALYDVRQQLRLLNSVYEFSLEAYMAQFAASVANSSRKQQIMDRITAINNLHTLNFYKLTSQSLYENHRLPFSFILSMKILETEEKEINMSYINFLFNEIQMQQTRNWSKPVIGNKCSDWLPEFAWQNVTSLKKLHPSFSILLESLLENNDAWREWYSSSQPECLPLIGEVDAYGGLQRLLAIVSLRPERLAICMTNFITTHLGAEFCAHLELDLAKILEQPSRSVLLLPGPGVDLQGGLEQLAAASGHNLKVMSLNVDMKSVLENAAKIGEWVYITEQNLSRSQLSKLEKLLDKNTTHENFRLWLSSAPHGCSFSHEIVQNSDKISIEQPKGLRWLLKRLIPQVIDIQENSQVLWQFTLLHSIILERKRFKSLGWNQAYKFSDSDFTVCCKLWSFASTTIAQETTKTQLVVDLAYTGRFTSPWDQRLLSLLANHVFTEQTLINPSAIISVESSNVTSIDEKHETSTSATLPDTLHAESYGLNVNAALPVFADESRDILNSMMLLYKSKDSSANQKHVTNLEKALQRCNNILKELPELLDESYFEKLEMQRQMKIAFVLEVIFYNNIIKKVKLCCEELRSALQGKLPWSEHFTMLLRDFISNQVPQNWTTKKQSNEDLEVWSRNFSQRVKLLREWKPQAAINLAIFHSPFAFLSSLLQSKSTHLIELDNMTWNFTIAKQNEQLDTAVNLQEGIIITGVKLEGAAWNEEGGYLTEIKTMTTISPMPDIYIRPTHMPDNSYFEEMYTCPCYLDFDRSQHVFSIPLNPGLSTAEHWVLRSAALIINLD